MKFKHRPTWKKSVSQPALGGGTGLLGTDGVQRLDLGTGHLVVLVCEYSPSYDLRYVHSGVSLLLFTNGFETTV